ncbi:hypothetical protein SAMN05216345_10534 [Cupriavidus sp. YR651]|uniref:mechanosensitive ion channel protein MscS n=1 Tax=Cupriavidus sp. YR651 TaxID=1855315 RepID=UPI000888F2C9|nr:mechanosensitive ion channel protein MscS [Cupriavidus sp. YR651]SDC97488.1 hypothetical protein SAMN05216345_10534 [Cupriavidus sp. YR651]
MRKSIRYTGMAVLCAAMVAAGPASAHGRYHGGGSNDGIVLALGALAGLAIGAAVVGSQVAVAAPAPVYAPPQPVSYAAPQVPPGYCYRNYDGAYVPCQPAAPVRYMAPQPMYGY